jgi:hypothetical protein
VGAPERRRLRPLDARLLPADQNAKRALANSRGIYGLFTKRWSGEWLADGLQEHAATIELFAWLAASPVPKT